jgi:hypothetical protein
MEPTATKLLLLPQYQVLLLQINAQPGPGGRVSMEQHRAVLEETPEIALWSSITDLRYFRGLISLTDVAMVAMEFAATRAKLGHVGPMTKPEALVYQNDENGRALADTIISAYPQDHRFLLTTSPQEAWVHVTQQAKMPGQVQRFLNISRTESLLGWIGRYLTGRH